MDAATRELLEDVCKSLALYEPVPCPILIRVRRALAGETISGEPDGRYPLVASAERAAELLAHRESANPPTFPSPEWHAHNPRGRGCPNAALGVANVWLRFKHGEIVRRRNDYDNVDWSGDYFTHWAPAS